MVGMCRTAVADPNQHRKVNIIFSIQQFYESKSWCRLSTLHLYREGYKDYRAQVPEPILVESGTCSFLDIICLL